MKRGRNSLTTDRLDMSFGELMSMYDDEELVIDPEFQRLFRWDQDQKTRFIESLLLGIPIPSIFVAENQEGKWEIVDGLQRLSTVLSFFGKLKNNNEKNNWTLTAGQIVPKLESMSIENLPQKYQFNIKRSVCRLELIKWDSQYDMRYELFNRLNTGGSLLTNQELRNCIFRGISKDFTILIKDLASQSNFKELIEPTEKQKNELYLDELVLRFFSLYKDHNNIRKKLSEHMTDYMRKATKGEVDYQESIDIFKHVVKLVHPIGKQAIRGENGSLSTSLYDGIFNGLAKNINYYENNNAVIKSKIDELKGDDSFKKVSGTDASHHTRVKRRIARALEIFSNHTDRV